MNRWRQYQVRDVMSRLDFSVAAEEIPVCDLDDPDLLERYCFGTERQTDGRNRFRRKVMLVSAAAAGTAVLTGAAVFLYRKRRE